VTGRRKSAAAWRVQVYFRMAGPGGSPAGPGNWDRTLDFSPPAARQGDRMAFRAAMI